MTRDELIQDLAQVLEGLQVPISLAMPLGVAIEPWRRLHDELIGFGWAGSEQYHTALREALKCEQEAAR